MIRLWFDIWGCATAVRKEGDDEDDEDNEARDFDNDVASRWIGDPPWF